MFQRRVPLTRRQKIREALWPHMGWKRLILYYKHRMGRLPGTSEYISRGMATGICISFTPFVGLHMLTGVVTCYLLRGSVIAMVLGSVIGGNLWTLPLIWIGTYKLGNIILGHHISRHAQADLTPDKFSLDLLIHHTSRYLIPMTVGSIPMVVISFALSYYLTLEIVHKYKEARLHRIQRRHHQHEVLEHGDHPPGNIP